MTDRAWNRLIHITWVLVLAAALGAALHGAKTWSPQTIIEQARGQR